MLGLAQHIARTRPYKIFGRVRSILGLLIEVVGLEQWAVVGSLCTLYTRSHRKVPGEVVGFRGNIALVMPFHLTDELGPNCLVEFSEPVNHIYPSQAWLGRVINGFATPIDGRGTLPRGITPYKIRQTPPPAHTRLRVGASMDLGVKVINLFTTCCVGQRLGIFAGSGIGKSVLLSMMARHASADVNVIGLIGERGREVQEFIQDYLGTEGLSRSIIVVATSDEAPLMRRQAALTTLAVAEFLADQGLSVLCMMDSVTRFAMSLREIGLSTGEPPANKGFTPSVFAELPKLLERAGPATTKRGPITGLFTVLVEGDDHNEPVADTVRGILDGHIILDRSIGERGRYPAVNVLKSVSRTMPDCNTAQHTAVITRAKQHMSIYEDMVDMINLGAYKKGVSPEVDAAIDIVPRIYDFLNQDKNEKANLEQDLEQLQAILRLPTGQFL